MFIDDLTYERDGRVYRRVLMRNSFRSEGRVCHETVANISKCTDAEIAAIKLALKHKNRLEALEAIPAGTRTRQGLSVGALFVLHELAKRLGIVKALGNSREAKLVLWLVYAAVMAQGSRLSAARLAQGHAVCDLLDLEGFTEDHLYSAMDWLEEHQPQVESGLFRHAHGDVPPRLYLYDVTSSYFEGVMNELAAFGYNRDGKKGKMQIVVGLLTDEIGRPVSVEVFPGNTSDLNTFSGQVARVRERFGGREIVFVGDRGMIRGPQIAALPEGCQYITAISKREIETLLRNGVLQMELFDETVCETLDGDVRYVLRRNPVRAGELAATRDSKQTRLQALVDEKNRYLQEHPKALASTAERHVRDLARKLKIDKWTTVTSEGRHVDLAVDADALMDASRLDGCYVIKTDVPATQVDAETVHDRYKDLSEVEWAFRTMKTALLEVRGIFVRKAGRTRAHVFITMLAYLLAFELRRLWRDVEMTVEEGVRSLAGLCATEVLIGNVTIQTIPEPRGQIRELLQKARITLPEAIPSRGGHVVTRKKLVAERRAI